MSYTKVRNETYDILCAMDRHVAWRHLEDAVNKGIIDKTDARHIYADVVGARDHITDKKGNE